MAATPAVAKRGASSAQITAKCMPVYRRGPPRRDSAPASAASASKRPCDAAWIAAGSAAASVGTYSGARTAPSSSSRVIVNDSTLPVSGSGTLTARGSEASSPSQAWRSKGHSRAHAASTPHAAKRASSAACASVAALAGSTMSGGATPSSTLRRTAPGNSRWYSIPARVP